jgi:hypothetical protein
MNLTFTLFGVPIIRFIALIIYVMKFIVVTMCNFFSGFVSRVNITVNRICTFGIRKICNCLTYFLFFIGKKTKQRIADIVSEIVCCWGRIIVKGLETIEKINCEVIPLCFFHIIDYFYAVIQLGTTWVCKSIDWSITWVMCLSYVGEGMNTFGALFCNEKRILDLCPVIITDDEGYSDWFIYVKKCNPKQVDEKFILGCNGELLYPVKKVTPTRGLVYNEAEKCEYSYMCDIEDDCGNIKSVEGEPLLYYSEKIIEIADRLMCNDFANDDETKLFYNIPTSLPNGTSIFNQYNHDLVSKVPSSVNTTVPQIPDHTLIRDIVNESGLYNAKDHLRYIDHGMRVTDDDCESPSDDLKTNTNVRIASKARFVCHSELVNIEANMHLDIDHYRFLMKHKHDDPTVVTVFFVNMFSEKEGEVGCTDLLGFVFCPFKHYDENEKTVPNFIRTDLTSPLFPPPDSCPNPGPNSCPKPGSNPCSIPCPIPGSNPCPNPGPEYLLTTNGTYCNPHNYVCDDDFLYMRIQIALSVNFERCPNTFSDATRESLVGSAEELIHMVVHQCGLMHNNTDILNKDMMRDGFNRIMNNEAMRRRIFSPMEWGMIRDSGYLKRVHGPVKSFRGKELPFSQPEPIATDCI